MARTPFQVEVLTPEGEVDLDGGRPDRLVPGVGADVGQLGETPAGRCFLGFGITALLMAAQFVPHLV